MKIFNEKQNKICILKNYQLSDALSKDDYYF